MRPKQREWWSSCWSWEYEVRRQSGRFDVPSHTRSTRAGICDRKAELEDTLRSQNERPGMRLALLPALDGALESANAAFAPAQRVLPDSLFVEISFRPRRLKAYRS